MEWQFKKGVEIHTEEFWYDLTWGGYIKPAEVLADGEQVEQLEAAIELVRSFEDAIDERNQ
uniref:Peptidase n=1 Tax=viral metagenome TaxID=1070528 RepID=A0A6M3IS09_9ZZZZ